MEPHQQQILLPIPEQPQPEPKPGPVQAPAAGPPKLKFKFIDRNQGLLRMLIVDELVGADHKVRAIWDLTGQLDLSGFCEKVKSQEGKAGRAAWDPRLLVSVWVYAYSEQVTSAREVARLMEYEPGLMWLAGLGEVNHHTLSDFRAQHGEELRGLLEELLGLLSKEGYVKLERVAHDGTKIRAQAGADTFRREGTLEREMARAREMVEELEREQEAESGQGRREAARRRAARERVERLEQAYEELAKVRASRNSRVEKEQARVSLSEPEARMMKHGDNAIAPSYNVQISTDAEQKVIVGVEVTQCSSDSGALDGAMEEVKETAGQYPQQVIADGGFTTHAAMVAMKEKQIDFYGSVSEAEVRQAAVMKGMGIDPAFGPKAFVTDEEKRTAQCPAGQTMEYVGRTSKRGDVYVRYRALASDCQGCEYQEQCCPRPEQGRLVSIRITEKAEVVEMREKMKGAEAQQIYRQRGPVAEFPIGWIKEKLGVRKFRLRGLAKAATEALWAVLTYDVMQWVRLSWRPRLAEAGAGA